MESSDSLGHNNNNIKLYHVALKAMARHPEVCCILLAVSFTLVCKYGYSIQTKPVIIPPKTPSRFFPLNSLVTDFPYGAMEPVTNILADNEFIFVMYYAPWCSKSRSTRVEFQKAARAMQGEVRFISINCWWKEGDCRKRMKFPYFPQFYIYHTFLNGFRFQGIVGAEHMVKFADNLRFPLTFIFNIQELQDFTSSHDTCIVGYFDYGTSPEPPGFLQFYYASMRMFEQVNSAPSRFLVINSKELGEIFDFRTPGRIAMTRRFNITLKFPLLTKLTSTNIVEWVVRYSAEPVVSWVIPPGMKSLVLSSYVNRGPVLLHFTRLDPLYSLHHTATLLEKSALAYGNCRKDVERRVTDFINSTVYKGLSSSKHFLQTLSLCDSLKRRKKQFLYSRTCCVSVISAVEANSSQGGYTSTCEICQHYDSMTPLTSGCTMNAVLPKVKLSRSVMANVCAESIRNYNVNRHTSVCCGLDKHIRKHLAGHRNGHGRKTTDLFMEIAKERSQRYTCRKLRLHSAQSLPNGLFPTSAQSQSTDWMKSAGLSCSTNQTLSFIVMDINYHKLFAERLGFNDTVDQLKPTSTVTVIVDTRNEWHSFMKSAFTENNLDIFLYNYSTSLLIRHRKSEVPSTSCDTGAPACVTDLSAQTFQSVVMDSSKDVLVLFYASWCGFCASLSHVYLALARYFKSATSIIFTRVNSEKNDLPWEFTVDAYPTLIFFPAKRKDDSVVFPDSLPKTLPNLIKFVLRQSTQDLRIDTAQGICSLSCIRRNRREVSFTVVEMYKHIRRIKRKLPQILVLMDNAKKLIVSDDQDKMLKFRLKLLLSHYIFLKNQLSKTEHQVKSAKLLEETLSQSSDVLSTTKLVHFQQQHKSLQKNFEKTAQGLSKKIERDEL